MPRRKARRQSSGTLSLIAGLLVASAALRLASAPLPAMATQTEDAAVIAADDDGQTETLVTALQERARDLDAREEVLLERAAVLAAAEQELQARLDDLVAAEAALSATLALAEGAVENDLTQLASVYENMKPKEAAALFSQMAPQFAAGFLGMMRPDAAADIMTELDPAIAYSFSVVLAGRHADIDLQ